MELYYSKKYTKYLTNVFYRKSCFPNELHNTLQETKEVNQELTNQMKGKEIEIEL